MAWQVNKLNLALGIIAWAGIAQFGYSVVAAIQTYQDYSLSDNFLSDLGCTRTSDGRDNSAAAALFNRALIWLGIALLPFFAAMPSVLDQGQWILRLAGLTAALGLIWIGLTPYDLYFAAHYTALALWVGSMLVTVVVFLACAELSGQTLVTLRIGTVVVVLAIGAYALAGSRSGYVIFQKVLVVAAAIWFALVFLLVSVSTVQAFSSRRWLAEQQARRYLRAIRRDHRRRDR